MADERTVLNHYNIANAYPTSWPAEKDDDYTSESERTTSKTTKLTYRKSKSRYTILDRSGGDRRSLVPGSEKTRDGVENLVQRDEVDPLGGTDSVVRALKQKGLPVEDDQRLRNRFLLSSTTFAPNLYLSQVHSATSTQSLLQGLEYLSRSIDQKSASLKVLVESNFERFVRAKSTIDDVYTEMRSQGIDPEPEKPQRHSRHASRSSTHYRNTSGQGLSNSGKAVPKSPFDEKKKHALTRESEYGVQGIKLPLIEIAVKAEEVWGPALGGRDREENMRTIIQSVQRSEDALGISAAISEAVRRKDYQSLVSEYTKARRFAEEARCLADVSVHNASHLTDSQVYQLFLTGRMWLEVQEKIDSVKREIWRSLTSVQANLVMTADKNHQDDHFKLINVLLELGVEDNPIWVWLLSRYDYLKNRITSSFSRSKVEIEVLRRRLALADKPSPFVVGMHLKSVNRRGNQENIKNLDSKPIIELWELIYQALSNLLSVQGGILGEVMDFWKRAQSFIDGNAQRNLPTGLDGSSRRHHRLSTDGVRDLKNGTVELVDLIRENVFGFFADPPIEDISMLYSPVTAETPQTPRSATLSPFTVEHRFRLNLMSPPPPSPKRGEPWEEFAFWPPYTNTPSAVYYLSKMMKLLGTAAIEMAALSPIATGSQELEKLKVMLNAARERSSRAICVAWSNDAEACKVLENWTTSSEYADTTQLPSYFAAFESFILANLQKVVFIPEPEAYKRSTEVITPPALKLLQMVRGHFVTSLYKALSGMVENAEKADGVNTTAWDSDPDNTFFEVPLNNLGSSSSRAIDVKKMGLRLLLTLSNLKFLRSNTIPSLIGDFESLYSVALTEESKTIFDVLSQIDARLFQSYTRPTVDALSPIIRNGIMAPDWSPTSPRPTEVRAYVYEALLLLVRVHTEVSTHAAPLLSQTISFFLEQISSILFTTFKERPSYNLASLMQATLDVEFFAQTLSQYTTSRASEIQGQVYMELDRKTDPSARQKLQKELPEMKAVLKRLRKATEGEFACFKRVKGTVKA